MDSWPPPPYNVTWTLQHSISLIPLCHGNFCLNQEKAIANNLSISLHSRLYSTFINLLLILQIDFSPKKKALPIKDDYWGPTTIYSSLIFVFNKLIFNPY